MVPPTQAGRFKPRKPAKRIVPGSATSAASLTAGVAADDSAATRQQQQRSGRGGRGGGRQPYGRGAAPMPRGQVFFTGNAAPESARSRSSAQSKSSSGGGASSSEGAGGGKKKVTTKMEGKHEASDEMIVGELDEAIGGGVAASNSRGAKDDDFTAARSASMIDEDAAAAPNLTFSIPDTYDSDSSEDERKGRRRMSTNQTTMLQPSCLPFPEAQLPVGIGPAQVRPSLYRQKSDDLVPGVETSSPFVDIRTNEALRKEEQKTWFLFQFPTRLPYDTAVVPPPAVSSEDVAMSAASPNVVDASDVSIPTILPNAFDNTMGAHAGKLGKISIYKSGKTVLDMGGTKFLISEGLPCGFAQHAVVIDIANAKYVPLGTVGKTVVVTPNVVAAFAE